MALAEGSNLPFKWLFAMLCLCQMLSLCTVCPPKQTWLRACHGSRNTDSRLKGTDQERHCLCWLRQVTRASTRVLLSCLWNATRTAIHQAVCIFCVQQREFVAFCCLLTRSRKDGEEGTACHSITWSCGRSDSVNKAANKSATHEEPVCRH